ncbi:helix-turn-helix domain-containing protein [SAR202 cluster bacterium AD-812-D07_MRT_10900m]|nr:helix-turn-helix domain-containing protein [SAR202 cluster bacterium AD-812-D07_MRT_10900m]
MTNKQVVSEFDDVLSDKPVLLSVTQVAEMLNISRTSVYRLLDAGDLKRVRINLTGDTRPTVRIPAESVQLLFNSWVRNAS